MGAIQAGDTLAFDPLWERLQPFMERYITPVNKQDRQDLQQTLALALWHALIEHPPQILEARTTERGESEALTFTPVFHGVSPKK